MIETFRLIEYADLRSGLEASNQGGYIDKINYVGQICLDVRGTKMINSNHMPILPIKLVGGLEKTSQRGGRTKSKANIHMVNLGKLTMGYLTPLDCSSFMLNEEKGTLFVNGEEVLPLEEKEKDVLKSIGLSEVVEAIRPKYVGLVGQLNAHNSTLLPDASEKFCFANIAVRDYFCV